MSQKYTSFKIFFQCHNDLQFFNKFKILNKKLRGSLTNVQTASFIHVLLKLNCLKENSFVFQIIQYSQLLLSTFFWSLYLLQIRQSKRS